LQGTNLRHDDQETVLIETLDQFSDKFILAKTLTCSELELKSKNKAYKRFMIIGYK